MELAADKSDFKGAWKCCVKNSSGILPVGEGMQKFTILGIQLCDFGVREALRKIDDFLASGALNTVAFLSGKMLAEASRDECLKGYLEKLDLPAWTDPDVLEAAGIAFRNRVKEIDERVLLRELLRKVAKGRLAVYILSDTEGNLDALSSMLEGYQNNLTIVGTGIYDEFGSQEERLVNMLNDVAPKIIISGMPWQQNVILMNNCGPLLNAELWLALPVAEIMRFQNPSYLAKLKRQLGQKLFAFKVNEYNNKKAGR